MGTNVDDLRAHLDDLLQALKVDCLFLDCELFIRRLQAIDHSLVLSLEVERLVNGYKLAILVLTDDRIGVKERHIQDILAVVVDKSLVERILHLANNELLLPRDLSIGHLL